jgi:hypothetical protein
MDLFAEIEKIKKGKKEVSDAQYMTITIVCFVLVFCLASQNAHYGFDQGSTFYPSLILCVMYLVGDCALATITSIFAPKRGTLFLTIFVCVGLFLLSLTAGVSFMLSQQMTNDIKASRVDALENELRINEEKFQEMGLTKTAQRVREIQEELQREKERTGANKDSSNAIYIYIAKYMNESYETVSFFVRAFWIFVFIATGMSLAALRGLLWCPFLQNLAEKKVIKSAKRRIRFEQEQNKIYSSFTSQKATKVMSPKRRLVTQSEIKEAIKAEVIPPTKAGVMSLGIGTNRALKTLKKLKKEGTLEIVGNQHQKV